jgi:hypothetical protein
MVLIADSGVVLGTEAASAQASSIASPSAAASWKPGPIPSASRTPKVKYHKNIQHKEFAMTAVLDPGRPFTGNERELLENTLELNRDELVRAWLR